MLRRVRQAYDTPERIADVEARARLLLDAFALPQKVRPGWRVAITAGSRGIADIVPTVRAIAGAVRACGAEPIVVPCMGSHGGATVEGQLAVLSSLGMREDTVGARIEASMEVEVVARSRFGVPVLVGADLLRADAVVVVNRVKPHTDFHGDVESGLVKMMAVGMGKDAGAVATHSLTIRHGFPAVLVEHARHVLANVPVLCGVAIVENHRDETTLIEVIEPTDIVARERELLVVARGLMPRLPFEQIDVLVVDEIGKDISGTGMDTNVIGRISFCGSPPPASPSVTRIFVRDLTAGTHGNACGIGLADYTTMRLVDRMDRVSTNVNAITASTPEDAKIPIAFATDREALDASLTTCGVLEPDELRLVWIPNTLRLQRLVVTEALAADLSGESAVEVIGEAFPPPFDARGDLVADWDF